MVEKLVPDSFLKSLNWSYLWINSLKFYKICFYCVTSWGLSKYIGIKLQTTCFHLILSFLKNFYTSLFAFLFAWTQKVCLKFLKSYFKLEILIFLFFILSSLVDMFILLWWKKKHQRWNLKHTLVEKLSTTNVAKC